MPLIENRYSPAANLHTICAMSLSALEIEQLKKIYVAPDGARSTVIDVPKFVLGTGEQLAMEGASGSGKTTLLRLIAGILTPDSGRIVVAGEEMTAVKAGAQAH